ncbi:hypothetical protein V6N00_04035 [Tersicoccus sp. MR15.9]|uniref:hypothetical protein n=1 Tax=Tersicoccus mangrovi TaxID=3121635 RepID=UPI002FE65005
MSDPREITLSVDYGQKWPLSDIMWFDEHQPDWSTLIDQSLADRLTAWARFFNEHANEETGSLGSEENRRWFDLEGVALLNDLSTALEGIYRVRLNLWF